MKGKSDQRSTFSNLSDWKEEAWKISGLQRRFLNWKIYCDFRNLIKNTEFFVRRSTEKGNIKLILFVMPIILWTRVVNKHT